MKRLFIANRGEICRRIALSARTLGIKTVTFSEPNPPQFLNEVIDDFIIVPDLTPATYLDLDFVVASAQSLKCDGVHPGYGFASEQAAFVEKVQAAGLLWVGPSAHAIRVMADKATARQQAIHAGVPCSVGIELEAYDEATVEQAAKDIRFPMLIKAAFGGGGRGMRKVENIEQLKEQIPKAAREAEQSFGHGTLILESYLTQARHIEVQILGDQHGHIAVIGDRDCSMQRRHQKVIEEAPAPNLPDHIREVLHKSSLQLAKAVNYQSAGTMEFLVDLSGEPRCFFLEMNTRLQVEHPVTEEVYGIDLVHWQLKIAQGHHLPQRDFHPRGHAIEVRIYAEDDDFRPTPGPIHSFQTQHAPGMRWDAGIEPGQSINSQFDPMIAKAICYAEDRQLCIARLLEALRATLLAGTKHNLSMLQNLLSHESFKSADLATQFIQDNHHSIKKQLQDQQQEHFDTAHAIFTAIHHHGPRTITPIQDASTLLKSSFHPVKHQSSLDSRSMVRTSERCWEETGRWSDTETGQSVFYRASHFYDQQGFEVTVQLHGHHYHFCSEHASQNHETNDFDGVLRAPVPGAVTSVKVQKGHVVQEGDLMLTLESMKIECEIRAPKTGRVTDLFIKEGDQLKPDQVLINMDVTSEET